MSAAGQAPPDHVELLLRAYGAYNTQDADVLSALVSDDVDWPGGPGDVARLRGRAQVLGYWTEQWTRTRTYDEPVHVSRLDDGRTAVNVSQVVRSLDGRVLSRGRYVHLHRIEGGQITRLDITAAPET